MVHPKEPRNWRGAQTQALATRIWYPVDTSIKEAPSNIGPPNKPIFRGRPAAIDAPVSQARPRYPLILISHGSGGSADSLDWLGAGLAARGYITAGVNHPGNNALEPYTTQGFSLWWERASDLSDVLDAMLNDAQFSQHIDRDRIGAAGFSLGGYAVLELAGARTNRAALIRFCTSKDADAICHPPEMHDIVERVKGLEKANDPEVAASLAHAGDSYRDPRVKAVFVIAPGLGEAFTQDDLREIIIPVQILAGAADTTAPVATNARRFAQLQPAFRLRLLPEVAHYTFLQTCIDRNLGDFCKDAPGVDRDRVHADAIAEAVAFFRAHLK